MSAGFLCMYVIGVEQGYEGVFCETCGHLRIDHGEDYRSVESADAGIIEEACVSCPIENDEDLHPYQPSVRRCGHPESEHARFGGCYLCRSDNAEFFHFFTAVEAEEEARV